MANVTFLGACGVVTGSATLLSWGDTRILVDCGFYQGGEELEQRNYAPFAFHPPDLTAVVLTHAHLDHTGLLPKLIAEGFSGPVYCTKASRGLVSLIVRDAGEIQEEEFRYALRKGFSRHPHPKPLYTSQDALRTLQFLTPIPFHEERELAPGVVMRYVRAGHLLGAASVEITAKGGDGQRRTWLFSGDVGRYGVPILKDPEPSSVAPSALLLESTYGDRLHSPEESAEVLAAIIERTFARGGSVVLPAFALGRTQELLYQMAELDRQGRIDPRAVFLDSPMAIDATEIYRRADTEHDEDFEEIKREEGNPLAPDRFQRCRTVAQSKALNARREPAVIIASSGMANAGRVVHHLLHRLSNPANTVVLTGYQAAGTRGRALIEGADTVAIHNQTVRVRAEVLQLNGLSAHGDRNDLLRWCKALPGTPERIFLNHGEDPQRKVLSLAIAEMGWPRPVLPLTGNQVPW